MVYTVSTAKSVEIGITDTVAEILQNVSIILATWRGSVPLMRDFGISSEFLALPVHVARPLIIADVKESVERCEPRATVLDVHVSNDERGMTTITVEIEVNDDEQ